MRLTLDARQAAVLRDALAAHLERIQAEGREDDFDPADLALLADLELEIDRNLRPAAA